MEPNTQNTPKKINDTATGKGNSNHSTDYLVFDPEEHKYFYKEEPMAGVTTILKTVKNDYVNDKAIFQNYLLENLSKYAGMRMPLEVLESVVAGISTVSNDLYQEYASIGTEAHKQLECYINTGDFIPFVPKRTVVKKMLQNFLRLKKENGLTFLVSELKVFHAKEGYAGTLDTICQDKDGYFYLTDFKTSKTVSQFHWVQAYFYYKAFGWMTRNVAEFKQHASLYKKINGSMVIRLGRDGSASIHTSVFEKKDKELQREAVRRFKDQVGKGPMRKKVRKMPLSKIEQ